MYYTNACPPAVAQHQNLHRRPIPVTFDLTEGTIRQDVDTNIPRTPSALLKQRYAGMTRSCDAQTGRRWNHTHTFMLLCHKLQVAIATIRICRSTWQQQSFYCSAQVVNEPQP
jgi:hypothetical protein